MKVVVLFLVVMVTKFLINASKLSTAKKLRDKYAASFAKDGKSFTESIPKARKLLTDAGLNNATIAVAEPIGFNRIASFNAKVADNLDSRRADMVGSAITLFDQMVGVFRLRMYESISPRYWVEAVIFLPRNMVHYLGGKEDGFLSKAFQIIYWIAAPLLVAFRADVYDYISILFSKIQ